MNSGERGYWDSEDFIYIEEDAYVRWIRQGGAAYHLGDENFGGTGAVHIEDKRNQLTDMITHMLHYARLHGLIDKHYDADAALRSALRHFEVENPKHLRKWMKALREEK